MSVASEVALYRYRPAKDPMPQFYFDILHDGEDVTRDHIGVDLPDLMAAKIEALEVWKRIIAARAAGGADPTHWNVAILNVHGERLAVVPYPTGDDGGG